MATPVLDFGAFSTEELTTMLTAAKAEYLVRMNPGRVRQGGSAAQQYGMDLMTVAELTLLINGLTAALGLSTVETRVSPDFSNRGARQLNSTFGA